MAYPPPDNEICNYLDWQAADFCEAKTRYLHLLGHLFKVVSDELAMLYLKKQPSYVVLAETWREHLENSQNRSKMYGTAVKSCGANDLVCILSMNCIYHSMIPSDYVAKETPSASGNR
jgi:hypothetical protein